MECIFRWNLCKISPCSFAGERRIEISTQLSPGKAHARQAFFALQFRRDKRLHLGLLSDRGGSTERKISGTSSGRLRWTKGTAKACRRQKEMKQKNVGSLRLVNGVESGEVDLEAFLCTWRTVRVAFYRSPAVSSLHHQQPCSVGGASRRTYAIGESPGSQNLCV
jgi:hypothetical protein